MKLSPLMGWTGGESVNKVGFVLLVFLLGLTATSSLLFSRGLSLWLLPFNLPTLPSSLRLWSLNREMCVLKHYVPLSSNNAQCPAFWFKFPTSYLANILRRHMHKARVAVITQNPIRVDISKKVILIIWSLIKPIISKLEPNEQICSSFYST